MRHDPSRFDRLLEQRTPEPGRCFCAHHYRVTDAHRGRRRFETPEWSAEQAMTTLGIPWVEKPCRPVGADTMGAHCPDHGIWLRFDAHFPVRVAAHELAHRVLGHEGTADEYLYACQEAEADATAMLVCDALGDDEAVLACRQYIWGYVGHVPIPLKVRERIKRAAQTILSAGASSSARLAA